MKTYCKVYFGGAALLLAIHAFCFVHYVLAPVEHYYRPWEFFDELAFRTRAVEARWDRPETGDLTRSHVLFYQTAHPTWVTTDPDGFRSRASVADSYPLVVAGDSNVYGSGLSDRETLPWRLEELTGRPAFNAARTTLSNAMQRRELRDAEIVVECVTERSIAKAGGVEEPSPYRPIASNDTRFAKLLFEVPPGRYSVIYRAPRWAGLLARDLVLFARGRHRDEMLYLPVSPDQDVTLAARRIEERARHLEDRGLAYLFVPIPAKQTIYAPDAGGRSDLISKLMAELEARRVWALDLRPAFAEHLEQRGAHRDFLYQPYDTHWSALGVDLAARQIAKELEARQGASP